MTDQPKTAVIPFVSKANLELREWAIGRVKSAGIFALPAKHDLDYSDIDELDEISGDQQRSLVWCRTHKKYEWHNLPTERG